MLVIRNFIIGGVAQLVRALPWHGRGHRFESYRPHQKIRQVSACRIFLSIAKAMAYHHALACISSPKVYIISHRLHPLSQWWYTRLSPWWYTKLRFDDMHACGAIWYVSSSLYENTKKYLFCEERAKFQRLAFSFALRKKYLNRWKILRFGLNLTAKRRK